MSKKLKTISGYVEEVTNPISERKVSRVKSYLYLNGFDGGENLGQCVQLVSDSRYIQLTKESCIELIEEIKKFYELV